jgi:hypothetical protein
MSDAVDAAPRAAVRRQSWADITQFQDSGSVLGSTFWSGVPHQVQPSALSLAAYDNGEVMMTEATPPAVQTVLDAANGGDVDAFLSCFTADGVVDDWGREFRGAARIRAWSDAEFIGKQVTLDVREVERRDGAIVVTAQVGGNGFNGPSHFAFLLDGDRVSRMTIRA